MATPPAPLRGEFFSMTVHGGDELARNLRALPDAVSKKIVSAALKAGGTPIRDRAARLMVRSAEARPATKDKNGNVRGASHAADHVGMTLGKSGYSLAIGPTKDYWYWLMQEYGTARHPAQPALRPAFDTLAPAALGIIGQQLWAAIRKQAGTVSPQGRSGSGGRFL